MSASSLQTRTADDLADMRRRLLRNLILLTLLTTGAILAVTMHIADGARREAGSRAIRRATERARDGFQNYFGGVRRNLQIGHDWGTQGDLALDFERPETLDARLAPILDQFRQISSVMLADEDGREYMLLRTGDQWSARLSDAGSADRVARWRRWTNSRVAVTQTEAELPDYDPRTRPWFEGAMNIPTDGTIYGTKPYEFFTTKKQGVTFGIRFKPPGEGSRWHVIAMDVLLEDVAQYTRSITLGRRGMIAIVLADGQIVAVPGEEHFAEAPGAAETEAQRQAVQPVRSACDAWAMLPPGSGQDWPFECSGERWWGSVQPLDKRRDGQEMFVAAVVPESDLLEGVSQQKWFILLIGVVAMLTSIALAVLLNREFRTKVTNAVSRARQLGQYILEKRIGAGGMGAVYKARHSMLRRPTAIKLLHADKSQEQLALKRFEREVQQTARLTNPNTIAIYDYGRTPDGVFYYAMEYLEGISLEDLAATVGRLPPERVIHILTQVCASLAEAHAAGLVHRDVKPANIMLCERGGLADVVKVLDFGLVKEVESEDEDPGATRAGVVAGTPLYMAPERVRHPNENDPRSDLYAVGAIGYLLLTGQEVFEVSSINQCLIAHASETPQRPSERIGAELDGPLEQVILDCLAKEPADRPQSAGELADRLLECPSAGKWSAQSARLWWAQAMPEIRASMEAQGDPTGETPGPLTIDLASRSRAPTDTSTPAR